MSDGWIRRIFCRHKGFVARGAGAESLGTCTVRRARLANIRKCNVFEKSGMLDCGCDVFDMFNIFDGMNRTAVVPF
jgi:hypothetical protein